MRPAAGRVVMSESQNKPKRNYGTGGLRRIGASWYGTWRDPDGRKVQRKVGAVRTPGRDDGITKADAEKKLRQMIVESGTRIPVEDRVTMEVAGREYCRRLAMNKDRKKSYRLTQASDLRNHIAPFFGEKTLDKISPGGHREVHLGKAAGALDQDGPQPRQHDPFRVRPGDAAGVVHEQPRQARRPTDGQRIQGRNRYPFPGSAGTRAAALRAHIPTTRGGGSSPRST